MIQKDRYSRKLTQTDRLNLDKGNFKKQVNDFNEHYAEKQQGRNIFNI